MMHECHENVNLKQKFEILRIENGTQKKKFFEQLEIIKQKEQNNLLYTVTKFESEKLLKLTIWRIIIIIIIIIINNKNK